MLYEVTEIFTIGLSLSLNYRGTKSDHSTFRCSAIGIQHLRAGRTRTCIPRIIEVTLIFTTGNNSSVGEHSTGVVHRDGLCSSLLIRGYASAATVFRARQSLHSALHFMVEK